MTNTISFHYINIYMYKLNTSEQQYWRHFKEELS